MKHRIVMAAALLAVFGAGLTLTGCKTEATVSKDEQANWKGGPMPANFHPGVGAKPAAKK